MKCRAFFSLYKKIQSEFPCAFERQIFKRNKKIFSASTVDFFCSNVILSLHRKGRCRMKKKILMLLCMILLVGTFAGCTDTKDTSKSESKPKKEATKKVIVNNDFIKATYLGMKKELGQPVLAMKIKNKTNKVVSVSIKDGSIDDTMAHFLGGADIQPKKTWNDVWITKNFPKKKIEFKLSIYDKDINELSRTKTIKIKMK